MILREILILVILTNLMKSRDQPSKVTLAITVHNNKIGKLGTYGKQNGFILIETGLGTLFDAGITYQNLNGNNIFKNPTHLKNLRTKASLYFALQNQLVKSCVQIFFINKEMFQSIF